MDTILMQSLHLTLRPMDEAAARAALAWRYEPPYDVYNTPSDELDAGLHAMLAPSNAYHRIDDEQGALVAYCCFGPDGQVPGGDYSEDALDIGLGVRPDLVGQGRGHTFVQATLDFALRTFAPAAFRVTVAAFNKRALRVWENTGFRAVGQFGRTPDGLAFVILTRQVQQGGNSRNMEQRPLRVPTSLRSEHVDILHGIPVPDPYRWLEEIDSEQTRQWITAQNEVTFRFLSQIPAREKIKARITELWDYEKYGVPFRRNGRIFFTRNDGLQNQSVLYWLASLDAKPQVLLDPNELSEDGTIALTGYAISEDGRLLAYGLSASGSDWQEWRVREVDSGQDLQDHLKWVKFSTASWTPDGLGFFYSRYDEPHEEVAYKGANYYHKLYYHRLGTAQPDDELIYERPDQKEWGFAGHVTEDGRYLIITVWRGTHRECAVFYRDLTGDGEVVELLKEFDASYIFVANDGPVFYFHTDLDAPMGRVIALATADVSCPARSNWAAAARDIIPESPDALQEVSLVGEWFVATYLHDAHSQVRVFDKSGALVRVVELPGIGTVTGFGGQRTDRETFYHFTGFTMPGTVYRHDLETGQSSVFREPEIGFDPDQYETRQIFYQSKDGTQVPMFIVHKVGAGFPRPQGLELTGDAPTYLYGYGGFDIAQTPAFSVSNLVWMEMGGIYALANLRGGGEYGKAWHEAGMKLQKQNVFDDFIAAAEWLIEQGYTSTPRLGIGGRSNGGLLIGACLTQRPDLFGACLPVVGVLDMLRFQKFTIGWAWTSDYGSPEDPEDFKALLAYSPYHNLKPGTRYPPTLIATGDHDDRVFPAHSFKFAAALQAAQEGQAPTLIRIETKAGHGLGKPTSKLIEETADLLAFLAWALEM